MNQKEKLIAILIFKYIQGICTFRDIRKLNSWLEENMDNKDFFRDAVNTSQLKKDLDLLNSFDAEKSWRKRQRKKQKQIFKWSIAASVFLVSISLLFLDFESWLTNNKNVHRDKYEFIDKPHSDDKAPARVGARLSPGNGERIQLKEPLQVKLSGEVVNSEQIVIANVDQAAKREEMKWLEVQVPAAQDGCIVFP